MSRIMIVFLILMLGACAHQPLTWSRTGDALRNSASQPSVWGPLLGASLFMVENLDISTTKHLADDTPVFGSNSAAGNASDNLGQLLMVTAIASAVTVPVPEGESAVRHRGDHLAVTLVGSELTGIFTRSIKQSVSRERPNHLSDSSFPSGHSSQAFFYATMASNNFHLRWGDSSTAQWADAGLYATASMTAYARVEANLHHPADVLVGASLGNFVGEFLNEMFLKESSDTVLSAYYDGRNFSVGITQAF